MRPAKILERMDFTFTPDPAAGFYLVDWRDDDAVWLLNQLLKKGVNVKVAKQEFSVDESPSTRTYPAGTLLIPLGIQPDKRELIQEVLARGAQRGTVITSASSGLTPSGIDFGSSQFVSLPKPKIAMPVAGGVSPYGAGEIWHLLDTRIGIPLAMLKQNRFKTADLSSYTTLLFPNGRYQDISSGALAVDSRLGWPRRYRCGGRWFCPNGCRCRSG